VTHIKISTDSIRGRTGLAVAQCAGMVDLVAMPVWVGMLVGFYKFDPQQAGLLVTLFLAGAVLSSIVVARLFHRLTSGRGVAVVGFAVASGSFFVLSQTSDFGAMAVLHVLGGLAIGAVLSVKDGTLARSANPHRLFAICSAALGIFALVFLGAVPPILAKMGGALLFQIFSVIMLVGALTSWIAFPVVDAVQPVPPEYSQTYRSSKFTLWAGILGLCCMAVVQSMAFSFLERAGMDRGFGIEKVTAILVALGFINLFPAPLAALLEKRLSPKTALMGGAVVQALLVLTIFGTTTYLPYAIAGSLVVAVMLFTHVFGFGLLARMDTTGQVLAATPAIMMSGGALGPVLGGTLVKFSSYQALGVAAVVMGALALICFTQLPSVGTRRIKAVPQ
jgi:predicted MFS family arabinose efflux permease